MEKRWENERKYRERVEWEGIERVNWEFREVVLENERESRVKIRDGK